MSATIDQPTVLARFDLRKDFYIFACVCVMLHYYYSRSRERSQTTQLTKYMTPAQAHNALVNGTQGRHESPEEKAAEAAKAAAIREKLATQKRHEEKTKAGLAEAEKQHKEKRLADLRGGWNGYAKVTAAEAESIIAAEKLA